MNDLVLCFRSIWLAVSKIPRFRIKTALAVMSTARNEKGYSHSLSVGNIKIFYFAVIHITDAALFPLFPEFCPDSRIVFRYIRRCVLQH